MDRNFNLVCPQCGAKRTTADMTAVEFWELLHEKRFVCDECETLMVEDCSV